MKQLLTAIILINISITTYGFNERGKVALGIKLNSIINYNFGNKVGLNNSYLQKISVGPAFGIQLNYGLSQRWQYGFSMAANAYPLSFVQNEFDGIIRQDAKTIFKYWKGVFAITNTINYAAANNIYLSCGIGIAKHFEIGSSIKNILSSKSDSASLTIIGDQKEYEFKENASVWRYAIVYLGISKNIVLNNNKNLSIGINVGLPMASYYVVQDPKIVAIGNAVIYKPYLINFEPRIVYWF
jgi:hypothetical protein